ncbi:hypothetical protein Tco_0363575 [Tanacetum coccineum]
MVDCRLWIKFMVWGTPGILKMCKIITLRLRSFFDEAADASISRLPYISLLLGKASQSLGELSTVEAPSIRETPST